VFGGEVPRQEIVDAVDGMIGDTGEQRPEEDPIHAERKRRAYVSLFASNVDLQAASLPAIPWNMGTRTLPLRRGLFAAVGSLLALKRPSSVPDILTALNFPQRAKYTGGTYCI